MLKEVVFHRIRRAHLLWRSTSASPSVVAPVVLVDDVLLSILCFCDISTVISMSQASKYLHSLGFSREVWLALVATLHARNFIDLPFGQSLRILSLSALIDLAKRTAQGPRSWNEWSYSPTVARSITLNTNLTFNPGFLYFGVKDKVNLLPGGGFVLFANLGKLRCWNVADDSQIWQYEGGNWNLSEAHVLEFAAEVTDEGRAALILVVFSGFVAASWQQPNRALIHLDLILGVSYSVTQHYLPQIESTGHTPQFSTKICGGFAIVELEQGVDKTLYLLRSSTQSYRSFPMQTSSNYQAELIPGYVILVEYSQYHPRGFLRVWSAEALIAPGISLQNALPILSQTISSGTLTTVAICLSAHASPFQEGFYTIWLAVTTSDASIKVYRYNLSLLKSPRLSIHRKVSPQYSLRECVFKTNSSVLYAGHALVLNPDNFDHLILSLAQFMSDTSTVEAAKVEMSPWSVSKKLPGPAPPAKRLLRGGRVYSISTYSGALTFYRGHQIVINYYD